MYANALTEERNRKKGDQKRRDEEDRDHRRQGQAAERNEIERHRDDKAHAASEELPEIAPRKFQHAGNAAAENHHDQKRQHTANKDDLGERQAVAHQLDESVVQRNDGHAHCQQAKGDERALHQARHDITSQQRVETSNPHYQETGSAQSAL